MHARKTQVARAGSGAEAVPEARPWEMAGYRGAAVSAMEEGSQVAFISAVAIALGLSTVACCSTLGEAVAANAPAFATRIGAGALGLVYIAGGVAHFTLHEDYCNIMPRKGAWGIWELPGTASFHVYWTGVAEILGGAGVLLGTLPFLNFAWLGSLAAQGLFVLTIAISPANVYSATHNAPGPGPPTPEGELPPLVSVSGHAGRFLLQVLLLTAFWELAHPR